MAINQFKTSIRGIAFVKKHEGLRLAAYYCSAGKLTVGYGHVIKKSEHFFKITEAEAEALLANDLLIAETAINGYVSAPLLQNQFDALVSFVFNLGVARFAGSTLLKFLNKQNYTAAANEFGRWDLERDPKTGVYRENAGLKKRRAAERDMFLGVSL